MEVFPGQSHLFLSVDRGLSTDEQLRYPVEFLNEQCHGGLPPHRLILKVGCPIILIRSLSRDLTNGTRAVVKKLTQFIIEARIINGTRVGETILIPRIPLTPTDASNPVLFKRIQFPVKPAFALTINKSQGETFEVLGVDLRYSCFTHGQLYVAVSRVRQHRNLHILLEENNQEGKTRNPVYQEALRD